MTNAAGRPLRQTDERPGDDRAYWVGNTEFVTLRLTGQETGDAFALMELVAMPGAEPPPHIHHSFDETYYVLEGDVAILDGERTYTATAGSVVYLPRGTLHAWRNATAQPVRALLFVTPAGFEGIVAEVGVPGTLSSLPPAPPPPTAEDLHRLQELGRKYDTEYPPGLAW